MGALRVGLFLNIIKHVEEYLFGPFELGHLFVPFQLALFVQQAPLHYDIMFCPLGWQNTQTYSNTGMCRIQIEWKTEINIEQFNVFLSVTAIYLQVLVIFYNHWSGSRLISILLTQEIELVLFPGPYSTVGDMAWKIKQHEYSK